MNKNTNAYLYLDDTAIQTQAEKLLLTENHDNALTKVCLDDIKLTLTLDKSKIAKSTKWNGKSYYSNKMNNKAIEQKSVFKYLSFYLDKKLEFKGFTNFANTKLNTSC